MLPAAPLEGSGAEKERDEGGDGSLKELVVFLHVARVPGMGGRLVTLMGQLGAGGGAWAEGVGAGEVTETFLKVVLKGSRERRDHLKGQGREGQVAGA